MKARILNFLIPLVGGSATSAFAADSALSDGGGPLVWFFIGFVALIIMVQAVPAMVMLYAMIKAVVSPADRAATTSATGSR
ncbi:MAG: hypothetical protein RBQ99_08575 [Trichlorobacter sp.]|jgi:hypothetical protein|nr:hypothetical protein [Trichlorobacter sp.]